MRIFVGDVHGCLDQLEDLLAAARFRPGKDKLYSVGDLVNKGPDSVGVLSLMMDLDAEVVLGNHDLAWLRDGRVVDRDQRNWLRSQPMVRVLEDVILVHAGLHPGWKERDLLDLDSEQASFAANVRYCDAKGRLPESDWPPPPEPFLPWDQFYKGTKTVVFGHWARRGLDRTDRTIALDSGCVYGKELSAWIAEEDRIVQVPGWQPPEIQ